MNMCQSENVSVSLQADDVSATGNLCLQSDRLALFAISCEVAHPLTVCSALVRTLTLGRYNGY